VFGQMHSIRYCIIVMCMYVGERKQKQTVMEIAGREIALNIIVLTRIVVVIITNGIGFLSYSYQTNQPARVV
jgi:hypothetical protein